MVFKDALDEALASGLTSAVCHPSLFSEVAEYVREREAARGPQSFPAPMQIAVHPKQHEPPILIFGTKQALREHLAGLDA